MELLVLFGPLFISVFLPHVLLNVLEAILAEWAGNRELRTGVQEVCLHGGNGDRGETMWTGTR